MGIPKIKELGLSDVVSAGEKAMCKIFESFIQDALEKNDNEKLEGELSKQFSSLEPTSTFGYLMVNVSSALGKIYASLIQEAETAKDEIKLEALYLKTKELKINSVVTEKAYFSLQQLYEELLDNLIAIKNETRIKEELIPKVKKLELKQVL